MLSDIYKASTADGELLDGLLCAPHYDLAMQKIKDTVSMGKEYSSLSSDILISFEKASLTSLPQSQEWYTSRQFKAGSCQKQ